MNFKFKHLLVFPLLCTFFFSCSTDEVTEEPTPEPEEPVVVDKSGNRQTTGTWGSEILTSSEYKSMHIEIGYVEGYKPADEALVMLKDFLQERVYKPDGIEISLKELPSSNKAPFDRADWESIEDENREHYNDGDELAIWIYYANGGKDDGNGGKTNAHGTSYKNTSIIIYTSEVYDSYSESHLPMALFEVNIIAHEFGHLFGLVNSGVTPLSEHADPNNPDHCVAENCLMAVGKNYSYDQSEIFDFDSACLEDLRSIGGK